MPLLIIVLGIGLQIFLTYKKVSPFISLLVVAILIGFALGMQPSAIIASIKAGVGSTLGDLALLICLGAVLGKILEVSGAAEQISTTLINAFGIKKIQWAVLLTGFLVGLPLYYNAGFVILVPLVFMLARKTKLPILYIAIPMAASLSTTHCFLPPHPSPVFLVSAFKADLGKTLIYGLILVIPIVIIAGIFLTRFLHKVSATIESNLSIAEQPVQIKKLPAVVPSFVIALLPVILIALAVISNNNLPDSSFLRKAIAFIGDPTIALLLSVLLAVYFFGIKTGVKMQTAMQWLNDALSGIAVILLIITAGGVLKQVLTDSGTGTYITSFSSHWKIHPLILGWLITALLRVAIGSATVAGLTAAAIVAPIVTSSGVSPELMVLSVGAGSVFGSHINDSAFWMFKEYFKISMKQTFLSWTVMETSISILGLIGVMILNMVI